MAREIVDPGAVPVIAVPVDGLDISPLTGVFGQLAAEFQSRANELRVIDAKRQGALAGIEGPVEMRKAVTAKGRAFNDAANQTSMNRLETSLRLEFDRLEQENPEDTAEFLRLSDTHLKSLIKEMTNQDPLLASTLELRGRAYQRSASHRIRGAALTSARDVGLASIIEMTSSLVGDIEQEVTGLFSEDPERVAASVDALTGHFLRLQSVWSMPDPDGTGTLLSQEEIAKRTVGLLSGIYATGLDSFIRHHDNPIEVAEAMEAGTFRIPALVVDEIGGALGGVNLFINPKEDLPKDAYDDLIRLAHAEQGRVDGKRQGKLDQLKTFAFQSFNARITELLMTGEASVPFNFDMAMAMKDGDELAAARLMEEMANEELIASLTPQVQAEHIFDTAKRIADVEVKGLDAPVDARFLAALTETQKRKVDAMKSQPYDYAMTTQQAKDAAALVGTQLTKAEFRQFMIQVQDSIAKDVFGYIPGVMQTDEALSIVHEFNQLENFQEALDFISIQQREFGRGKNLELALNDLVKQGLPPFSAVAMGMDSRTREARVLMRAWKFGKELDDLFSKKEDKDKLDADLASRMQEITAALPGGNDKLVSGMFAAATLIAKGLVVFDEESLKNAARLAYESVVESRWTLASGVAVPVDKMTEQIKAAVTPRGFAEFINLNRHNIDAALITGDAVSTNDYIETLLEEGQFVPDAEDKGQEVLDSQGRPVLTHDGKKLKAFYDTDLHELGEEIIVKMEVIQAESVSRIGVGRVVVTPEDVRRRRAKERRLILEKTLPRHKIVDDAVTLLLGKGFSVKGMTNEEIVLKATEVKRRRADRKK